MPDHKTSGALDAIIKSLIAEYRIATATDISRIIERLDRIERLIAKSVSDTGRGHKNGDNARMASASSVVFSVIKESKGGADFNQIKHITGYNDKKLRNIIFRLNKINRITRLSRGVYVPAEEA